MNASVLVGLLGITAAVSWGISDFFAAKSAKSIGAILASALVNIVGALTFIIVYILFLHPQVNLTWSGFSYAAASGIFLSFGAASFFVGLEAGPVSIVSPLTSTYPLITTILALLVFHAHLSSVEIVGIVLTMLGITAASGLLTAKGSKHSITKGPAFALLTALMWGIGFALLAQAIKRINWQPTSFIEFVSVSITFLLLIPFVKGKEVVSKETIVRGIKNQFVIGASIIQLLGVIALDIGISKSTASGGAVITAISACYPVLTIFLALKHFGEKVKLIPICGAFIGIAGVVILSLG